MHFGIGFVIIQEKNMSITVNTNTQSLFAQRALSKNTFDLQKSIEKLSTGFRINRAGDDAAGLTMSEKLTTRIRSFEKVKQNAGDGISLLQTAEGALSIVQDNLQRIRELVTQGNNGTNNAEEKEALQRELNERVTAIDAIASQTKFNGNVLIKGATNKSLQLDADGTTSNLSIVLADGSTTANTGIEIDITTVRAADDTEHGTLVENASTGLALNRLHISGSTNVDSLAGNANNFTATIADIDAVIKNVSRMRSYLGAVQNSLESRIEFFDVAKENAEASRSRIKDVDIAAESSKMLKSQILQQSAASMLSQANATPQIALSLLPRG